MTENNAAQAADVLVDYEVYQEDELVASSNSLPHAEQYAEQYSQDGPVELRTSISIPGFHVVESALLSKLRAEGVQAGDERARRSALASAPVAGEAQKPTLYQARTRPAWRPEERAWSKWEDCTAEQAADYERVPLLHDWQYEVRRLYAAPQASEAVRQAIKGCGSNVIKALAAIARADGPDTRKADDPELIYRSPVMDEVVRIRQAYDELESVLKPQAAKDGAPTEAQCKEAAAIARSFGGGTMADVLDGGGCAKGAGDGQQKYWLCCGSTEPEHRNRRAPDCFNADRAKWGTAGQHSATQKQGDSDVDQ